MTTVQTKFIKNFCKKNNLDKKWEQIFKLFSDQLQKEYNSIISNKTKNDNTRM